MKNKFSKFLNSLKNKNNAPMIEAIEKGFKACMEGAGPGGSGAGDNYGGRFSGKQIPLKYKVIPNKEVWEPLNKPLDISEPDIKAIYDNGGETLDRYTVVLNSHDMNSDPQFNDALGLSDNPTHPQGFSQFTSAMDGDHLGKRIRFDQLPMNIRQHITDRLAP